VPYGRPRSSRFLALNAAMGSTQFGVALALAHGSNGLKDYWGGHADKAIYAGATKVILEEEPEFSKGARQAVVSVETNDGKIVKHRQEEPKGEPTHPMSREELDRKFSATASLVLEEKQVGEIVQAADDLHIRSAAVERTARLIMAGQFFAPHAAIEKLRPLVEL
jgi:2-methylcitrate dehydratase PrpD